MDTILSQSLAAAPKAYLFIWEMLSFAGSYLDAIVLVQEMKNNKLISYMLKKEANLDHEYLICSQRHQRAQRQHHKNISERCPE